MRRGIILAAVLTIVTATGARAEGWCGYAAGEKSMIECGYSSVTACESAIGKGGMCFLDPGYALNERRMTPAAGGKLVVGRS